MESLSTHGCPLCARDLEPDRRFCPHCGTVLRPHDDPVEVRTKDVVLSVIMAVAALAVTLPVNWSMMRQAWNWGWSQTEPAELLLVSIWNGLFLGLPLLFLARRWYTRVRRGEFHPAWVWRDYWFLQLCALSPFIILGMCFGYIWFVCWLMVQLS